MVSRAGWGFEVKLKAYGEDETVTDYSGGWSPFAVLSVIDSVLTDPIGAIDDLLGSLPGLLEETGTEGRCEHGDLGPYRLGKNCSPSSAPVSMACTTS